MASNEYVLFHTRRRQYVCWCTLAQWDWTYNPDCADRFTLTEAIDIRKGLPPYTRQETIVLPVDSLPNYNGVS